MAQMAFDLPECSPAG